MINISICKTISIKIDYLTVIFCVVGIFQVKIVNLAKIDVELSTQSSGRFAESKEGVFALCWLQSQTERETGFLANQFITTRTIIVGHSQPCPRAVVWPWLAPHSPLPKPVRKSGGLRMCVCGGGGGDKGIYFEQRGTGLHRKLKTRL